MMGVNNKTQRDFLGREWLQERKGWKQPLFTTLPPSH